jgi:hypothetical protein
MHAWRELRDSYILKAVIEELPEDVGFEYHGITQLPPKALVVGKKESQLQTFWRVIYRGDRT